MDNIKASMRTFNKLEAQHHKAVQKLEKLTAKSDAAPQAKRLAAVEAKLDQEQIIAELQESIANEQNLVMKHQLWPVKVSMVNLHTLHSLHLTITSSHSGVQMW